MRIQHSMRIQCALNLVLVSSVKGPSMYCYYLGYWYILYVTLLYCCYLIQDKATPVFVAAQNGHVEALSVLISTGADVNAASKV